MPRASLHHHLARREAGLENGIDACYANECPSHLQLSYHDIISPHTSCITTLDIDRIEHRFLLSGSRSGLVALHDLALPTRLAPPLAQHAPLLTIDSRSHREHHKHGVSSVCWYPVDSGMFFTGGLDQRVLAYDANRASLAASFRLPGRVMMLAASPIPTHHALLAVATDASAAFLCDLTTGAATHALRGHRGAVLATCWLTSHEHHVATGGADGAVLIHDVRRPGALFALDRTRLSIDQSLADKSRAYTTRSSVDNAYPNATMTRPTRGRAHDGLVTGLQCSADGRRLMSAGTDCYIRTWDLGTASDTQLVCAGLDNATSNHPRPFAACTSGRMPCLAHASGHHVHVYHTETGRRMATLRGHLAPVHAVAGMDYASGLEVVSGGEDTQLLWYQSRPRRHGGERRQGGGVLEEDEDCWSEVDEVEEAEAAMERAASRGKRRRRPPDEEELV